MAAGDPGGASAEQLQLCFDRQIFGRQRLGGISRYFNDLIQGLEGSPGVVVQPHRQRGEAPHLIHATFYGGKPHRLQPDQALVSTLFDMVPERHPEQFFLPALRSPHANKLAWLAASNLVLSISAASANDLAFFAPGLKVDLRVIHLGTGIDQVVAKPVRQLQSRRFWLMVGKRQAYKNGLTLLQALARLQPDVRNEDPLMVFAGGAPWSGQELRILGEHRLESRVIRLDADDPTLAWLITAAEAVLVPSMAEGFSLPLIEALACNTAVVASDLEVHREVAGDYATLLPAQNAGAWAEVLAAASAKALEPPQVTLGMAPWRQRRSHYSLERMVSDHLAAYRQLIGC